MSSETPDVETFLFVKKNIAKYQLDISITSKPVLFPRIPLSLKKIKPAIIANKIISIYSKL